MAKKTTKKAAKSNELDGKEFFAAIALIEKEKGIPRHYMLEKITQALVSAYKRDHEGVADNVFVEANEDHRDRADVRQEGDRGGGGRTPPPRSALEEARKSLPSAQSWATWSASRSSPGTSAASPPRPPGRSSSRACGRPSTA